jgi:hypothetical protein
MLQLCRAALSGSSTEGSDAVAHRWSISSAIFRVVACFRARSGTAIMSTALAIGASRHPSEVRSTREYDLTTPAKQSLEKVKELSGRDAGEERRYEKFRKQFKELRVAP